MDRNGPLATLSNKDRLCPTVPFQYSTSIWMLNSIKPSSVSSQWCQNLMLLPRPLKCTNVFDVKLDWVNICLVCDSDLLKALKHKESPNYISNAYLNTTLVWIWHAFSQMSAGPLVELNMAALCQMHNITLPRTLLNLWTHLTCTRGILDLYTWSLLNTDHPFLPASVHHLAL